MPKLRNPDCCRLQKRLVPRPGLPVAVSATFAGCARARLPSLEAAPLVSVRGHRLFPNTQALPNGHGELPTLRFMSGETTVKLLDI